MALTPARFDAHLRFSSPLVIRQGEWPDEKWADYYKRNKGKFNVHRVRIIDHKRATLAQLRAFVAICDDARAKGSRLVVHCWRGHGRTSQLVAAYLVSRGAPAEQAIAQARPWNGQCWSVRRWELRARP